MTPEEKIKQLEERLDRIEKYDRYLFARDVYLANGKNIVPTSETGMLIATATDQKLGFWGVTPAIQPSSTGVTGDMTVVGGAAVTESNGFGGNFGTKYYTIGDIVKHLKTVGILKKNT